MTETRNENQLKCGAEGILCRVTITGNQGVAVCGAGRQCVPLSVYTNSIFFNFLWLGFG